MSVWTLELDRLNLHGGCHVTVKKCSTLMGPVQGMMAAPVERTTRVSKRRTFVTVMRIHRYGAWTAVF